MPPLPITPPVFAILNALIEERTGIHHDAGAMSLLAEKVSQRAADAGFTSLLDYYYYLRYDAGAGVEMDALIDTLVVNETYFFREPDQLRVLVDELLAPVYAAGRTVRIWCAACSTGEEPYSVAMLLGDRGLLDRTKIVATDISSRALARARDGRYGRRSIRNTDPSRHTRWLARTDEGVEVRPVLREAVHFARLNLVEAADVAALEPFDAILLRNVLIYFDDETARTVVDRVGSRLAPGGTLLVGTSESLLRLGTLFECVERSGVFYYRRSTA